MIYCLSIWTKKTIRPNGAIRILDVGTRIAVFVFAIVTGIALPLAISIATGAGSITIDAAVDEPFVIELFDGRRVSINDDGVSLFENFAIGEENITISEAPVLEVAVNVQPTDIDSRAISLVSVLVYLGAAWWGLLSLRKVVRSAAAGEPFNDRNPQALRSVAWSILAILTFDFVRVWLLNASIESDIAVHVLVGGTSRWILVTTAVGFFALAWIFAEAGRLRRFEEATI